MEYIRRGLRNDHSFYNIPYKQEPPRILPVDFMGGLDSLHADIANVGHGVDIVRGTFLSILGRQFALVKRHAGMETKDGAKSLGRRGAICYIVLKNDPSGLDVCIAASDKMPSANCNLINYFYISD